MATCKNYGHEKQSSKPKYYNNFETYLKLAKKEIQYKPEI